MKRILIISPHYRPFVHPRAFRWTAIAEHWASRGHEVHVICAANAFARTTVRDHQVWVHRTGFSSLMEVFYAVFGKKGARGRVGARPAQAPGHMRLLYRIYRFAWQSWYFPDDAMVWMLPAMWMGRRLLAEQPFDVLITVSLPFSAHLVGRRLRKRHSGLFWIADCGDPYFRQMKPIANPFLYRHRSEWLEKRVLSAADRVSFPAVESAELFNSVLGEKVSVIPPLLTEVSGSSRPPAAAFGRTETIDIGYFGAFYSPTRTPDALLDLLARLKLEAPALHARLKVHFFGDLFPEFFDRLSTCENLVLHGLRSREEVFHLMRRMDFLLHIGNKTDHQLPSKAVDYLGSGRPVIHLSFVRDDPFVRFWGDAGGMRVFHCTGAGWESREAAKLLVFLQEGQKGGGEVAGRTERAKNYSASAIAAEYEKLWHGF